MPFEEMTLLVISLLVPYGRYQCGSWHFRTLPEPPGLGLDCNPLIKTGRASTTRFCYLDSSFDDSCSSVVEEVYTATPSSAFFSSVAAS